MAPVRRRLADRAELAARLQYMPQQSALAALMQQAMGEFERGVAASRSAARGVARSARAAIRPSRQEFRAMQARVRERRQAAVEGMQELGEVADPYRAAMLSEATLADQLARQQQRGTVNELRARAVQARQGAAHDVRALRAQLASDLGQLAQQSQLLSAQEGAAAASIFQDLLDARAERNIRRRRLGLEQQRVDLRRQELERRAARDAARRRGRRLLTLGQANQQWDRLEEARGYVRALLRSGELGTGQIRDVLRRGRDKRRVVERAEDGSERVREIPGIPRFPNDLINAAFDLEVLGYLSRPNIRALRKRGLTIGDRYPTARRVIGRRPGSGPF